MQRSYVRAEEVAPRKSGAIKLHGAEAFEGMRRAGRLAAEALDMITAHVTDGTTTDDLDQLVHTFARDHKAVPAPLNYRGYPKSICTSLNHVVCHGIPGERVLKDGDILNIDVTLIVDGWHGDTSRMYAVGDISKKAQRLLDVTYTSLMLGIEAARPGAHTGDIGAVIEDYVTGERCSVVRDFCGHGLGRVFHDEPNILHFGQRGEGDELRPGMFFTIEPMINLGKPHVKVLKDGWTAVTRDKSLSAQFEHSVGVTEDGVEIFTLSPAGYTKPPYG
ncbi:MAG: type I methionyl aminopeptidase [Pseudomonadota bacterium]